MARVTMADIAKRANVNKATVSRALRGDSRISASTSERIWKIARELGYQLDTVASGLSSRSTDMVGVVVRQLRLPWMGSFLSGVHRVLSRYKMEFLVLEDNPLDTSASYVAQRLEGRKVDGVIWMEPSSSDFVLRDDLPLLLIGNPVSDAFQVSLDEVRIKNQVLNLAGGRPINYVRGEGAMFSFLGSLAMESGRVERFVIQDGFVVCSDLKPDLVCCDSLPSELEEGMAYLVYPSFELGMLSARVVINMIRQRSVRPNKVLVSTDVIVVGAGDV